MRGPKKRLTPFGKMVVKAAIWPPVPLTKGR